MNIGERFNPSWVVGPVLFLLIFSAVGGWMATGVAESNVAAQVGEQRLEAACNELGVEWEYYGVYKVDGERLDYGITDAPRLFRTDEPHTEQTVTINCHLNQGFLSSTDERVTVNVTGNP